MAQSFFAALVAEARGHRSLNDEHFTVDGTLIEAWATAKKLSREAGTAASKGRARVWRRGAQRDTHESVTAPGGADVSQGAEEGAEEGVFSVMGGAAACEADLVFGVVWIAVWLEGRVRR